MLLALLSSTIISLPISNELHDSSVKQLDEMAIQKNAPPGQYTSSCLITKNFMHNMVNAICESGDEDFAKKNTNVYLETNENCNYLLKHNIISDKAFEQCSKVANSEIKNCSGYIRQTNLTCEKNALKNGSFLKYCTTHSYDSHIKDKLYVECKYTKHFLYYPYKSKVIKTFGISQSSQCEYGDLALCTHNDTIVCGSCLNNDIIVAEAQ